MDLDEGKPTKTQFFGPSQRWIVGIGLCVFGCGAWSFKKYASSAHPKVFAPQKFHRSLEADKASHFDLAQEPESLEDILRHLEGGDSFSENASPSDLVASASALAEEESAGAAKMEPMDEEEAAPKKVKSERRKKSKPSKTSKKSEIADTKKAKDSGVDNALSKLESTGPAKADGKKAADKKKARAILDDALNKLKAPFASRATGDDNEGGDDAGDDLLAQLEALGSAKKSKPSEADKRKAKDIIRDTLAKMAPTAKGQGPLAKSPLQKRLEALLAEKEGDADVETSADATAEAPRDDEEGDGKGADTSYFDFANRLKEEAAQKPEADVAKVKEEFKRDFGAAAARPLLCSGCKLVANRLSDELSEHSVHDQDSPALMLAQKRKAIDATCGSLRHLGVVTDETGPKLQAVEAGEEGADGKEVNRVGKRLCYALLEDAKFELLSRMMRRKVPTTSHFHMGEEMPVKDNWERVLCAQRARLCKRNEVREDDEDEEL
mmetsp:Transcript_1822/g.4055  ORF Transcript_1822/g.4055 Transcript_1822/m.4055 type:complete len:494 (+) Transcript_1822:79-1560(+)